MADGKFYIGLLVLPLYEGALDNISGYAVFSDSLEPTEEEIDKTFLYNEKKVQQSQREYEKTCSMLDE